jgi:uncharacterized protein
VRIGIISDTHGLLRPEAVRALAGVEWILHAGDIGAMEILTRLESIAPVTAVVGNTDGRELRVLPETAVVELAGARAVVLHGHRLRDATPARAAAAHPDADLVVFGHSHRPGVERVGPVLTVNPGSAGPRRFRDPVTLALAEIVGGAVSAELVQLLD